MPRLPHRIVLITGAVTALLIGGLAVALISAKKQARSDLERGFGQRATIAASLIQSILTQAAQSSVDDSRAVFSGRTVTTAAVRKQNGMPGQDVVVVGSSGRVLAAWPAAAGRRGQSITPLDDAAQTVLDGRDWVLEVGAAPEGKVSIVAGFDTSYGRRVVISSFPRGLMQAFLGGYLGRIRTSHKDDAFLVDAGGAMLSSGSGTSSVAARSLPVGGAGPIQLDGVRQYFASAPVDGTHWAVVVTVPQSQLYAPVGGLAAWLPWGLLLGVTLLAGLVMVLVRRLARGSVDLAEANRDLEVRNAQVVAADQMKSTFLATMSHELRTPLNGIIGFAELMHDGRVGPVSDQHREYLGDILSSSSHLRRLIDDILDLSKIEAGKIDLRPERVECAAVVQEVCDIVGSLAVRKNITLRTEVDPAIDPLDLDPGKLKQVLFNYLSNALKFTPDGGTVSVSATLEPGDRFRIVVEDDGPGISDGDLVRLWSAFEQLDTGSSRRHGGTGLGLSLTRSIVEAQGGEVSVQSTVGVGSRFHVVLPRVAVAVAVAVPEPVMV